MYSQPVNVLAPYSPKYYIISEAKGNKLTDIMIYHNGQKLDENTDQQVLWEIVVDEDIDIPFEEYADGDISNATIIEYIEDWIEAGDEMGTVEEKSLTY